MSKLKEKSTESYFTWTLVYKQAFFQLINLNDLSKLLKHIKEWSYFVAQIMLSYENCTIITLGHCVMSL